MYIPRAPPRELRPPRLYTTTISFYLPSQDSELLPPTTQGGGATSASVVELTPPALSSVVRGTQPGSPDVIHGGSDTDAQVRHAAPHGRDLYFFAPARNSNWALTYALPYAMECPSAVTNDFPLSQWKYLL